MRVPSAIAGEYYRLGTAVREKRITVEQALKEIAQICVDRHEHFGLMLVPIAEAPQPAVVTRLANAILAGDDRLEILDLALAYSSPAALHEQPKEKS